MMHRFLVGLAIYGLFCAGELMLGLVFLDWQLWKSRGRSR
jgi:hypothetical protein